MNGKNKLKMNEKNKLLTGQDGALQHWLKPVGRNVSWFLAGLVDADGHIMPYGYVQITFNARDLGVARYVARLVPGSIKPGTGSSFVYLATEDPSIQFWARVLRHRLRLAHKRKQFNTHLAPRAGLNVSKPPRWSNLTKNAWLLGFVMGDAGFEIKIRPPHPGRGKSYQVEVVLQMEVKPARVTRMFQSTLGGYVGYRASRDTWRYSSVSLARARLYDAYFVQHTPFGSARGIYQLWRQALYMVLAKKHLESSGLEAIKSLKTRMGELKNKG